jgi:hypothetical protein
VRSLGRLLSWASFGTLQHERWTLTTPHPVAEVPLRHEYAYGGTLKIEDAGTQGRTLRFTYPHNPVGCGYLPNVTTFKTSYGIKARQARASLRKWAQSHPQFAAAQIENLQPLPDQPDQAYPVLTWGVIPKHWSPRIELAGTYDAKWEKERHPLLPEDFNALYWNGANPELRFTHLPHDAEIELKNLIPHTRKADQTITIRLPGVSITAEYRDLIDKQPRTEPLTMDTVHVDLIENKLTLLYRINLPDIEDPGYLRIFTENQA